MSYDRMVAALQEDKAFVPPTTVDILVSTLGHRMLLKEKLALVKDLWSAGLRADIAHDATWVRLSLLVIDAITKDAYNLEKFVVIILFPVHMDFAKLNLQIEIHWYTWQVI